MRVDFHAHLFPGGAASVEDPGEDVGEIPGEDPGTDAGP